MKRGAVVVATGLLVLCLVIAGCAPRGASQPIRISDYDETIRVACVGASNVIGFGLRPGEPAFPEQLGRMLGSDWEVTNWGYYAASVMQWEGHPSFLASPMLDMALAYNPHVAIIQLGIYDTALALKEEGRLSQHKEEFISRYKELIDSFANLETRPRIWICVPLAVGAPSPYGPTNPIIEEDLIPLISQVAEENKVGLIDLYGATADRPELYQLDNVLLNAEGAKVVAQTVYKALTGREPPAE